MSKTRKLKGPTATPPAKKDNSDIFREMVETLELTIRGARRCAYDLNHCAGELSMNARLSKDSERDRETAKMYEGRAQHWVGLFQSGNAMKDYRHRLYAQISDLEYQVETLRGALAKHKIADPTNSWERKP